MKRRILILIVVMGCSVVSSLTLLKALSQETPIAAQRKQEIEATPIQLGVMTEREKLHSKVYGRYDTGDKIQDLLRLSGDDIQIRRSLPFPFSTSDRGRADVDEIKRVTCAADVILIGTVKKSDSQVTVNERFLFTDYVLLVREVLKNNSRVTVAPTQEVEITRPGGVVLIGTKRVTAIDESFLPLRKGAQYLLFLRYLSETDSFSSIDSGQSYELKGSELRLLKGHSNDPTIEKTSLNSFLNEVAAAAAVPCN